MAFDPTASEQELMQLTNRFRTDPQNEFSRLMVSASPRKARDPNVDFSLSFFNTNTLIVQQELAALTPVPPLAWDPIAQQVAQDYLPLMAAAKSTSHNLAGTFQERIGRYPFDTSRGISAGENLFANAFSPVHAHASYVLEWGNGPDGLQGRGHRNNLMKTSFKQAGMAFLPVTYEPAIGFGPNLNAQEMIGLGVTAPMVTGAVFQDSNSSGWYDAGEGLAGVQITFDGPSGHFVTNALSAGGYNVALPPGTYTAVANAGGMRFPVSIPNVVVGTQNVWLNFLYDPAAIPPDARERNDDFQTATVLTGRDQVLTDGTIHRGDVDYFRFPASTDGPMRVDLRFANSSGNLDLRVLDVYGNSIAQSATSGDLETVTVNVTHANIYYLVVEQPTGGSGGPYTLQVTTPPAQSPLARPDATTTAASAGTIFVDVMSNDNDPDGNLAGAQLSLISTGRGAAQLTGDSRYILYTPPSNFDGIDRLVYTLIDQQGLSSAPTMLSVMVLDFNTPQPFHNAGRPVDVNGDGALSALDALLVINEINTRGSRRLPTSLAGTENMFGLVDVNGSDSVEPLDALLVINALNLSGGTGESLPPGYLDDISSAWKRRR